MKFFFHIPKSRMKFHHQLQSSDCAAACLAMITSFFGKKHSFVEIKNLFEFTRIGVTIQDLIDASKKVNLNLKALKLSNEDLNDIPLPIILYWRQDHFVILEKIIMKRGKRLFYLADPAYGRISLNEEDFTKEWKGDNSKGIILFPKPNEQHENTKIDTTKRSNSLNSNFFNDVLKYSQIHRNKYFFSFLLILVGLSTNWFVPLIFQKTIDLGVEKKNMNLVYILLISQLILFCSNFCSNFISQKILTKVNFNLSITLKNKFLNKLIQLPISYFDTHLNTETLQRLNDQYKIQNFLTWKGIEFLLNVLNLFIFGSILFYFSSYIFLLYLLLSILSTIWILFFLKKRATNDYAQFLSQSENNNYIYEFIMNMAEIKINDAQSFIINKILNINRKINTIQLQSLFLNMYQLVGVNFISKLKEIISIGICALLIIDNKMTIGTMLSISYVIGQLTGPIQNLIDFVKEIQDTKIANRRIGEIYKIQNEDFSKTQPIKSNTVKNISIDNISFKYPGNYNPFVLSNLTFNIPRNSVTAIVGASGSGKTTLIKLLLLYYQPSHGEIRIDKQNFKDIYSNEWRKKCGTVLQDGHIFSGTILDNIVFSDEKIDYNKLDQAVKIACISSFIETLPMGYNTKIGNIGIQLSGGQKQRLLIARAVYKNPDFIFLDEATSALDAENEKKIYNNLQSFFTNKTVIIVAHRLSTVKNATQIIVLKEGVIVEQGSHNQLIKTKKHYYQLIKNQLELGE